MDRGKEEFEKQAEASSTSRHSGLRFPPNPSRALRNRRGSAKEVLAKLAWRMEAIRQAARSCSTDRGGRYGPNTSIGTAAPRAAMLATPLSFYRGAALNMVADLATTPTTGVYVQACGDAHLVNFRGFATPERQINFDIHDLDETLPAWEWDLKRLATSFVLACRDSALDKASAENTALACARSYREHMGVSVKWEPSTYGIRGLVQKCSLT